MQNEKDTVHKKSSVFHCPTRGWLTKQNTDTKQIVDAMEEATTRWPMREVQPSHVISALAPT